MYINNFMRSIALTFGISLPVFLIGCGGSGNDGLSGGSNVAITKSSVEGMAPLTATFGISGVDDINVIDWDFGDGTSAQSTGNVSHTYNTAGIHTVTATVQASVTEKVNATTTITVLPDVNLVVSSFAIDSEVTPNGLETVSAIIQNTGTMPLSGSGYLHVGYYLSTDPNITVDDIYIGDTSILIGGYFTPGDVPFGFESLGAGGNYQYNHQLYVKGNIPTGTYYAGAIVDYIDDYDWYSFARATDTDEYQFPDHLVVPEADENDNARLLNAHQVTVSNTAGCGNDPYEDDDNSATATQIALGESQDHNFCDDNSDWLQFEATQGAVYEITTTNLGPEADTQLILYDRDARTILLFHDNMGTQKEAETVDLYKGTPVYPASEIVWEAEQTGTYFIKVRTTTCDEDEDHHCSSSPDGVGLGTEYTVTLQ